MVIIMVMLMVFIIVMFVIVAMIVQGGEFKAVGFAKFLIPARSVTISITGAIFKAAAYPLHMMMVTFLNRSNLILKTKHLLTKFAHGAIHQVLTGFNFMQTLK